MIRHFVAEMTWIIVNVFNVLMVSVTMFSYAKAGWIGNDAISVVIGESDSYFSTTGRELNHFRAVAILMTFVMIIAVLSSISIVHRIFMATSVLTIISLDGGQPCQSSNREVFLNAATLSKEVEGTESRMSLVDFKNWCRIQPSVRKFLGSLLMPPDSGRPGFQVPDLHHPKDLSHDLVLLRKEYAWHIGGAIAHQELKEWKLLYHSTINGDSAKIGDGSYVQSMGSSPSTKLPNSVSTVSAMKLSVSLVVRVVVRVAAEIPKLPEGLKDATISLVEQRCSLVFERVKKLGLRHATVAVMCQCTPKKRMGLTQKQKFGTNSCINNSKGCAYKVIAKGEQKSVAFSAGLHGWAFTLTNFAKMYASSFGVDESERWRGFGLRIILTQQ